jgi:hypothetical protein
MRRETGLVCGGGGRTAGGDAAAGDWSADAVVVVVAARLVRNRPAVAAVDDRSTAEDIRRQRPGDCADGEGVVAVVLDWPNWAV